jgi:hypothetical protein
MANGFKPNANAFSSDIKTIADAPSFKVDALAAVTVPSFLNTGFNPGILSNFTALNSSSSATMVIAPARPGISTATISSWNNPFSNAACALW